MNNLQLICEAKIRISESVEEKLNPSGKIEARVTTWGAREGEDGRKFNYQPHGFAEWAAKFAESNKPLPMFLNHNDMGMPIGEWTEFNFDDEGMTANGRIYLNTVSGSDVYTVLKESPAMFGGVSVGAYAEEACFVDAEGNPVMSGDEEDGYFQITKGGLREVSVVMYPNNPNAEIHKLEAFDDQGHLNPRVLEKTLREAGVSKKDATTASSIFKKILEQREVAKSDENSPNPSDSDAVETEAKQLLAALELRELEKALNKRLSKGK